jgi:hypothetical protein
MILSTERMRRAVWFDDIRVKAWQLLGILAFGAALGGIGTASAMIWAGGLIR